MKKVKNLMSIAILTLVLLVSVNLSAQITTYSEAEVSEKLDQVMLSLVQSAKPYYLKGDSYRTFRDKLYGKQASINPSEKGEALIKKVYSYVSSGASEKTITDGSLVEIANAYLFIYKTEKNQRNASGEMELFGSTTGDFNPHPTGKVEYNCCFFCLSCHLNTVFGEIGGPQVLDGIIKWILILLNP